MRVVTAFESVSCQSSLICLEIKYKFITHLIYQCFAKTGFSRELEWFWLLLLVVHLGLYIETFSIAIGDLENNVVPEMYQPKCPILIMLWWFMYFRDSGSYVNFAQTPRGDSHIGQIKRYGYWLIRSKYEGVGCSLCQRDRNIRNLKQCELRHD